MTTGVKLSVERWETAGKLPPGNGSGPFCDVCGCDLSLADWQVALMLTLGNPLPRPPCSSESGLHRLERV